MSEFRSLPPHQRAAVELGFHSAGLPGKGSRQTAISLEGEANYLPEDVSVTIHSPRHPEGFHAKVGYRTARTTHEISVFPDGHVRMPKKGSAALNINVLATVLRVHKALEKSRPK